MMYRRCACWSPGGAAGVHPGPAAVGVEGGARASAGSEPSAAGRQEDDRGTPRRDGCATEADTRRQQQGAPPAGRLGVVIAFLPNLACAGIRPLTMRLKYPAVLHRFTVLLFFS